MAGAKETPRQKMIGMMYLVLTAMLALNVAKDILNAFEVVDDGLVKTNKILLEKNDELYAAFGKQYALNKEKNEVYYNKATEARKLSSEMIATIKDYKRQVIAYSEYGNIELKEVEYKDPETEQMIKCNVEDVPLYAITGKDNYDKPMFIMVNGETEANWEANVLKGKIDTYKEKMLALLDKDQQGLDLGLNTDDYYNTHENREMSWAFNTFYHTVLAADVVIFNKLIAEVYNAQNDVIGALFSNVSKDDFKFDQIDAQPIFKANVVSAGTNYEADIMVMGYSTTEKPIAYIAEGKDTIALEEALKLEKLEGDSGRIHYKVPASGTGDRMYCGYIGLKKPNSQDYDYRFFRSDYTVAQPSAVISATAMNVLYQGVDNPIEVSVQGVPSSRVSASFNGASKKSDGKGGYLVRPTIKAGQKVKISASYKDATGSTKSAGSQEFRVRRIPNPIAKIGGKSEGKISKAQLVGAGGIIADKGEFLFDVQWKVLSYEVVFVRAGKAYPQQVRGSRFASISSILRQLPSGQQVSFSKIIAQGPDGSKRNLNPIVFTIR